MEYKKIPWWMPRVEKEDYEFIKKALDNNFVNDGPLTEQLEKEIAKLVGARYAIATTSGTSAIFLALKSLGIGHNDEVIVPDMTFIATANAARLCGATVVLADIDPLTLTIDPQSFEKAITPKTKAVVPVHVTGRGANMDAVLKIAKTRNIFVVEDAAEALTSKQNGKCLGIFGDAGCFSFSANKTVATGQGGMIVTENPELVQRIRSLKDQGRPTRGSGGDDFHNILGYNFKYTDLQAGMGLGQLAHLAERTARMKKNYELYAENLKDVEEISIFKTRVADGEVPQWTDILVPEREKLNQHLHMYNMDCRNYWFPIHRQLPYELPDDNFPHSTKLAYQALWLPSAFTLTDEDVLFVCDKIKEFFARTS